MVNKEKNNLTLLYSLVLGAYWMTSCCAVGFAIVFLKSLSFNNFRAGIIAAAASLCGTLLGMAVSSLIDRRENITSKTFSLPLIIVQGLMLAILLLKARADLFTALVYIIYSMIVTALGSLLIKMYVDLNHQGYPIDYSFGRGIGSLSYVIASLILGRLLSSYSERTILYVGLFSTLIELCATAVLSGYFEETETEEKTVNNGSSMIEFLSRDHGFMLIVIGAILMFYSHCILTSFTINIVNDLGGNAGTVGYMNGFMAAMEIPVALFYSRTFTDHTKALKISAISMSAKAIAVALSFNIPLLFMSLILQAPSFALYITCIVPYVEENIAYKDSAKAQSLAFSAMHMASILASIIGGYLFDRISVRNNLYISAVITLIGSLLILYTLHKGKKIDQDSDRTILTDI